MSDLTDAQYAAFVDRVINCREAEDRAKADTKQVYAEIAEAGEDKTAIGLLVRELRVSEKDRIKANLRDAAVEDGRARYRRGKASHVRAREADAGKLESQPSSDEPEHDADGVIIEREVPVTVSAAGESPAMTSIAAAQAANANEEDEDVAPPPAHAPEQPGTDHGSVSTPDEGGAHSSEITETTQKGGQTDPLGGPVYASAGQASVESPASNITPLHRYNPKTHFENSKGLPRLHGCQRPESCGGSHRALCFGCQRSAEGSAA